MPTSSDVHNQQLNLLESEPSVNENLIREELQLAAQARNEAFEALDPTADDQAKKVAELRYWVTFEDYSNAAGYDIQERNERFAIARPKVNEKLGINPEEPTDLELLRQNIDQKRQDYAKWTAICRTRSTRRNRKQLEQARQAYEQARDQIGSITAQALAPGSFSELKTLAMAGALEEIETLESAIVQERLAISETKKLKGFYDWWARQGGANKFLKGKLQKSSIVGGIGLVSGLAAGAAGAALLGPAVGVTAGALVARSVSRGLATAKINKEAEVKLVAQAQSQKHLVDSVNKVKSQAETLGNNGNTLASKHLTDRIDYYTNKEIRRNRNRMIGGVAIGLATGLIGAGLGWLVHEQFITSKDVTTGGKTTPTTKVPGSVTPDTEPPVKPRVPTKPPIQPTPTPPEIPIIPNSQVDLNQWTWQVAHELHPGQEVQIINQALQQYSAETGLPANLIPFRGTTMIQVGNHIVNPAEMYRINELVVNKAA